MKLINENEFKNLIGANVKKFRIRNNLTQQQLSAKLETIAVYINRASISKIEKQRRIVTDYELIAFSKVLNVNIQSLFD